MRAVYCRPFVLLRMEDNFIYILDIVDDTTVDGPGLRTSVYGAGCENACPGCHNPESWDINNGKKVSVNEIFERILFNEFSNVTFSGGDPFFQIDGFAALAERVKSETRKTIWCYTGYKFEALAKNHKARKLLELVDVLVDGPFVQALRSEKLYFRGSSNQRLVDVKRSLERGEVVIFDYDPMA